MSPPPTTDGRGPGWDDAALIVRLLACDPFGVGGVVLRGRPGPVRDRVCAWIGDALESEAARVKIPCHVSEDRLLGGIALAETLASGTVVREAGLLSRAHGGIATLAMAERMDATIAAHLCAALDRGELAVEREGSSSSTPCRLGVVVLDEGIDDERLAAPLRDRLAFSIDLDGLDPRMLDELPQAGFADELGSMTMKEPVALDDEAIDALVRVAASVGVDSTRAVLLAGRVAAIHAALDGRGSVSPEDLEVAARLVIGPRARWIPAPEQDEAEAKSEVEEQEAQTEPRPEGEPGCAAETEDESERDDVGPRLDEIVLEAVKSAMPDGLLDAMNVTGDGRKGAVDRGRAGASERSVESGRPAGTLARMPQPGNRLAVLDTLRAAAPWQRLRGGGRGRGLRIYREDFRVRRFVRRKESCVIFAVDASGSAALQRLAEAKGAVEHVLADCYVRRDHVALIAFRGTQASVVLPPTRSLARVRRELSALAGGGTTPLASGIDAALSLADDARKRGRTPLLVVMTDGRGNVTREGEASVARAREEALESSRRVRGTGIPTLLLDTGPRARPRVRTLANEMNARYLPLPRLDAAGVSRQVQQLARESTCR